MGKRNTGDRIVTNTPHKVMIKIEQIGKALSESEKETFLDLLDKLKRYDTL